MSTINYTVTVASAKFLIDGAVAPKLTFRDGDTYVFDQADSSNAGHILQFSITSNNSGSSEYTTGVTKAGTPGNAGAKTTIVTSGSTTDTLYYYSSGGGTYGEEFSNTGYNTSTNNLLKPIVGAEATAEKWGPMINHNIDQIATTAQVTAELNFKAPLANPDFTGTVDLTGTTVSLDNDEISGDKIHGGTISGSPTLVTPDIGTPSAGVVTNLSGVLPVGVTGGSGLEQYFVENPAATQNLSGTYSTHRKYFNNSYTLTGNVTISATGRLILSTLIDEDITITHDGSLRTITGEGILEMGMTMPYLDYETGTWTPASTGWLVSGSFTSEGRYTKFRTHVRVYGWVKGSTSIGTSGNLTIGGPLPFTLKNNGTTPWNWTNGSTSGTGYAWNANMYSGYGDNTITPYGDVIAFTLDYETAQ